MLRTEAGSLSWQNCEGAFRRDITIDAEIDTIHTTGAWWHDAHHFSRYPLSYVKYDRFVIKISDIYILI